MTYEKQIETFVKEVSKKIIGSTIKIYCRTANKIVPYCTGVTARLSNKLFILTSEHAFQNTDYGDLIVIHKGFPLNLEGNIHGHKANDIALFELDPTLAGHLSNEYTFIETDRIEFNHSIKNIQNYLLIGFPNSKTTIKGTLVKETPLAYLTEPVNFKSNMEEIAISYKKRKSLKYNQKSYFFVPDPVGLSGSGLWYISKFDINPESLNNFKLIGIFKEYNPKNNIGLVTRIETILTFY